MVTCEQKLQNEISTKKHSRDITGKVIDRFFETKSFAE